MRSFGILIILLGAVIAYLGYRGEIGDAWKALTTGQGPAIKPGEARIYGQQSGDPENTNPNNSINRIG